MLTLGPWETAMEASRIGLVCLWIVAAPLQAADADPQIFAACVSAREAQAAKQIEYVKVIAGEGCSTGPTAYLGHRGYEVASCNAQVCYEAPPNRPIIGANAHIVDRAGDNIGVDGPHYYPNREVATKACFNVWASSRPIPSDQGWVTISVTISRLQQLTDNDRTAIALGCMTQ